MPLTRLPTGHSDLGNSLVEISSPFPSDSSLCQVDSQNNQRSGYGDLSLLCPFNIHSVQWSLSAPVVTHFLLHDSTFSYLRDTYGLWVTVILWSLRGEGFLCLTPVSFSSSAIGVEMCLPFFRDPELWAFLYLWKHSLKHHLLIYKWPWIRCPLRACEKLYVMFSLESRRRTPLDSCLFAPANHKRLTKAPLVI